MNCNLNSKDFYLIVLYLINFRLVVHKPVVLVSYVQSIGGRDKGKLNGLFLGINKVDRTYGHHVKNSKKKNSVQREVEYQKGFGHF